MLTKPQAEKILQSGKLHGVKTKNDIPRAWWQAMGLEHMSDINGPFAAGCTGPEPHCRLVAAALSDESAALISETGGIAYFVHLRLFEKEGAEVKCVYEEMIQEARKKQVLKLLEPPAKSTDARKAH